MKNLFFFLLMSVKALASGSFELTPSESLTWTGKDAVSGETCELSITTDEGGWVSSLLLTGTFKGFSLSRPHDLTPTGDGYYGTVDLFQNYSYLLFRYESHVFSKGLTLIAPGSRLGSDKRKASLFGDSLKSLKKIKYQDHNAFIQLDGECTDLVVRP